MRFDDEVLIKVSVEKVWEIYADVARWPEWTASIRLKQTDRIERARIRP